VSAPPPGTIALALTMALQRGLRLTGYTPGAGMAVQLPAGATLLDAALAIMLTEHPEEVAEALAASAATELLADLERAGIGGDEAPT
jgi:hypothetical protein